VSGSRGKSVRGELITLIEADIEADTLPLSRGNKIERKGYAKTLGITKSAMSFYLDVFQGFETLVNSPSQADALSSALRNVMKEMMETGELQLAHGRVNRTQVLERVGRSGGALLRRHTQIRELFAEWDQKVIDTGYRPYSVKDKVTELQGLLCLPKFLRPTTGFANRSALFRAMNGAEGNFGEPFKSLLDEFDAARIETLENDSLSIKLGSGWLNFHEIVEAGYPESVVVKIAHAFELANDKDDANLNHARFRGLRKLLLQLSKLTSPSCRQLFGFATRTASSLAKGIYDQFVIEYSDYLVRNVKPGVLNNLIVYTNRGCELLSRIGVFPPLSSQFRKRKVASNPNRTLAEVFVNSDSSSSEKVVAEGPAHTKKIVQFARSMFDEVGEADFSGEIGKKDTNDFLRTLADELSNLPESVTGNPVKAILHVLNSRFTLLRDHFRAQCARWTQHLQDGAVLINKGKDPRSYLQFTDETVELTGENIAAMKSHFIRHTGQPQAVIADLLRLVKEVFGSVYPNQFHPIPAIQSFFAKLCEMLGSRLVLQAYLTPHKDLIGSSISLYLLESGANLSVARTLLEDSVEETNEIGFKQITGAKARASGKPIVAFLETNSDALLSIETVRQALVSFRALAPEKDRNLLFLLTKGCHLQGVKAAWFSDWFKGQVGTIDGLSALDLTPNMLRPSILLQAALEQNGRLRKAIMLAQHGESVAGSYYFRFPVRFLHDAEIRSYLNSAEAIAVHRLPDGAAYLNISQEEFDVRVAAIKNIGLGTGCRDPHSKPGLSGGSCDSTDCFDCPNVFLIADPQNVAALQLWRSSLLEVEGDWIRDHPDRWEHKYMPWLTFIEVVEEEMQQPNLIDIWDQGSILAHEISNNQGYRPYRPIS